MSSCSTGARWDWVAAYVFMPGFWLSIFVLKGLSLSCQPGGREKWPCTSPVALKFGPFTQLVGSSHEIIAGACGFNALFQSDTSKLCHQ